MTGIKKDGEHAAKSVYTREILEIITASEKQNPAEPSQTNTRWTKTSLINNKTIEPRGFKPSKKTLKRRDLRRKTTTNKKSLPLTRIEDHPDIRQARIDDSFDEAVEWLDRGDKCLRSRRHQWCIELIFTQCGEHISANG